MTKTPPDSSARSPRCTKAGGCSCNCCNPREGKHCEQHGNNCHKDCIYTG